jgi:hypothetical protein
MESTEQIILKLLHMQHMENMEQMMMNEIPLYAAHFDFLNVSTEQLN